MKVIAKEQRLYQLILTLLFLLGVNMAIAQETTLVQVKTFDLNLNSISNLQISFDRQNYFATGTDGTVFIEIRSALLPPRNIHFKDINLEAESWNYSKGILEIIVREKSFETYNLTFKDANGIPLKNIVIKLDTDIPLQAVTNSAGIAQVSIPVNTDMQQAELFKIEGYRIIETSISENSGIITASLVPKAPILEPLVFDVPRGVNQFTGVDAGKLDSLKSVPEFVAFISVINMANVTPIERQALNDKFTSLYLAYTDSLSRNGIVITNISDSSQVSNDIIWLTQQAMRDGRAISQTREEFNRQIDIINSKIADGGANLSDADREKLLAEITALDKLLLANETLFTNNQSYYQSRITDIKNRLLNIQDLEAKLSDAEILRRKEERIFRNRLLISISIAVGLLFLVFLFIYLIRKISKQKKALVVAHEEVKEVNDHLEELVAKRTRTLQRVNKELDTFLYRSSHDLKRPLSSIIGLANIAKITLNKEGSELFEKARETADSMDKLLQKLITISQINYAEDYSAIHFPKMLADINNKFKETIEEKGATVTYNIADDIVFNSDPKLVECILHNLIENALFYSSISLDNKPKVDVSVYTKNESLYVEVHDNGEGISKDIKSKIWNMFYRGHADSSGNGLGLYITKRAVKVLKGDISFETISGKFTKFNVKLPLTGKKRSKTKGAIEQDALELA